MLAEVEAAPSGQRRGRPSRSIRFRTEAGVILAASLGEVSMHAAVTDLDGRDLVREFRRIDVQDGPEKVLRAVHESFRRLLRRLGSPAPVWAVAVGLPGPMDYPTGRVVTPRTIPGWAGFDVRSWFAARYDAPVWVDNEANLRALGEWERGHPQERRDLLYVKVATGIGSGLVTDGRLHRGDCGAAGDIGHVRVTDDPAAVCRCGKTGCLEALAGGWALVRTLTERARAGDSPMLAERLAEAGEPDRRGHRPGGRRGRRGRRRGGVRAARVTGTAIAGVINFLNPGTLVLGGGVLRPEPCSSRASGRPCWTAASSSRPAASRSGRRRWMSPRGRRAPRSWPRRTCCARRPCSCGWATAPPCRRRRAPPGAA